ncbi:hypothetical protein FQN54_002472 [Arachnomyces sp. PD_36]|nr:hypothetical protein FQN54_002472 [Arachnomyces sp. PD_36]
MSPHSSSNTYSWFLRMESQLNARFIALGALALAALSTACNPLENPTFETGSLGPWIPSAENVANIVGAPEAYEGEYYLDLETAPGNRANQITQNITGIDTSKEYPFSIFAQVPNISVANYCSVYVYTGTNATTGLIASEMLPGQSPWTEITGTYKPKSEDDVFTVSCSCTLSGASHTGHVYLDGISLGGDESCEDTPCHYPTPAAERSPHIDASEIATESRVADLPDAVPVAAQPTLLQEYEITSEPLPDFLLAALDNLDTPEFQLAQGNMSGGGSTDMIQFNSGSHLPGDDSSRIMESILNQYPLDQPTESPKVALAKHSMELIFRVMRTWPRMLAEEFQLPPLIHPTQRSAKELPLPLANCITLTKMWGGQCEGSELMVRNAVLKEVDDILDKFRDYDEITLLGALQALVMYTIILLFPSKNSTETMWDDATIFREIRRIVSHVVSTGLFLQEEKEHIRPSWTAWVHVTSKRRAILSLFIIHWAYSVFHDSQGFDCRDLAFMPAPAAKVLWQAGTEEEWNTLYIRWLARWDGRGFLQGEFDKIQPGIVMQPRAEKWLEETDEFGYIMISITNATEFIPKSFGLH